MNPTSISPSLFTQTRISQTRISQTRNPQFQGYQIVVGKEKQLNSLEAKLRKLSAEQGFQLALDKTAITSSATLATSSTPKPTSLASILKQVVALAKQSTEALKPKPASAPEATTSSTASPTPKLNTVTTPEAEALNSTVLAAISELIKDFSGLSVKPDDLKKWGEPGGPQMMPQVMIVYTGEDATAYENNQAVLIPILKAISAGLTKASELFAEYVGKLNEALGVTDPRRKELIPRLFKGALKEALPTLIAALPPELQDIDALSTKLEALQKDPEFEKALQVILKGESIPAEAPASLTPEQVRAQVSAVLTLAAGKLGLPEAYATALETSLSGPLNIAGDLLQAAKDPITLPNLLKNRPRPVTVPSMYMALKKPVVTAKGAPLVSTKPIRLNLEALLTVIGGALKAGRDASQNYGIKLSFKPKATPYPPQVLRLASQLGIAPAEAAKLFDPGFLRALK